MRVVLIRKLADRIDGIELSGREVGDVMDLPPREAALLLAEEWAIADRCSRRPALFERRRPARRAARRYAEVIERAS